VEGICNQSQGRSLVADNDLGKEHDDIEYQEQDNTPRSGEGGHLLFLRTRVCGVNDVRERGGFVQWWFFFRFF